MCVLCMYLKNCRFEIFRLKTEDFVMYRGCNVKHSYDVMLMVHYEEKEWM